MPFVLMQLLVAQINLAAIFFFFTIATTNQIERCSSFSLPKETTFTTLSLSHTTTTVKQKLHTRRHELEKIVDWNVLNKLLFQAKQRRSTFFTVNSRANVQEELTDIEKEILFLEENSEDYTKLPEGKPEGFYVTKQYQFKKDLMESNENNETIFHNNVIDYTQNNITIDDIQRLNISSSNISLPVALMLCDRTEFPTFSRARKACRKGIILVHSIPNTSNENVDKELVFRNKTETWIGRVGDRINPFVDVIGKQTRMGSGYFPLLSYAKPPFDLPVVYEDNYFAIVNKPAGVVVYGTGRGSLFRMSIRAALPFVLQAPESGIENILRRPASVHRLDKATSGLLVIAKTKPAMVHLTQQFHDRVVKKSYTAVINGLPEISKNDIVDSISITTDEAIQMGFDIDTQEESYTYQTLRNSTNAETKNIRPTTILSDINKWQLIDAPLDEKSAITLWKSQYYVPSYFAYDGYLTLVQIKIKTGRYHQIRRHFSWYCNRSIVGDDKYDGGTDISRKFRGRGLFLSSNKIKLQHPYYNTPQGRIVYTHLISINNNNNNSTNNNNTNESNFDNAQVYVDTKTNLVMVKAEIDLPDKFYNLLDKSEIRYNKLSSSNELHDELDDPFNDNIFNSDNLSEEVR